MESKDLSKSHSATETAKFSSKPVRDYGSLSDEKREVNEISQPVLPMVFKDPNPREHQDKTPGQYFGIATCFTGVIALSVAGIHSVPCCIGSCSTILSGIGIEHCTKRDVSAVLEQDYLRLKELIRTANFWEQFENRKDATCLDFSTFDLGENQIYIPFEEVDVSLLALKFKKVNKLDLGNSLSGSLERALRIRPDEFHRVRDDSSIVRDRLQRPAKVQAQLQKLNEFKELTIVNLADNDLTSYDLGDLPGKLEALGLKGARLTEGQLSQLAHLKHLKRLGLHGVGKIGTDAQELWKKSENLKYLDLSNNDLSKVDLETLPHLTYLNLANVSWSSDKGDGQLFSMLDNLSETLNYLNLYNTPVASRTISVLITEMTKLKEIVLVDSESNRDIQGKMRQLRPNVKVILVP